MEIFNDLARTLKTIPGKQLKNFLSNNGFALGTIVKDGLLLDDFKFTFNKNEFKILDYLNLKNSYEEEEIINAVEHSHLVSNSTCSSNSHSHGFLVPKQLQNLKVGDRVLVCIINSNLIILGRVTDA